MQRAQSYGRRFAFVIALLGKPVMIDASVLTRARRLPAGRHVAINSVKVTGVMFAQ